MLCPQRHSYVNHTATTALLLTVLCTARSSSKPLYLCLTALGTPFHYGNPYSYSRWHHHRYESLCFYARPHSQCSDHFMHIFQRKIRIIYVILIATGVRVFIPDDTIISPRESMFLCLTSLISPWKLSCLFQTAPCLFTGSPRIYAW